MVTDLSQKHFIKQTKKSIMIEVFQRMKEKHLSLTTYICRYILQ